MKKSHPDTRHGLTMIEILIAVALATFIVSIGFTGINAFSKAISRAKQFTAETQILAAILRYSVKWGDGGLKIKTNGTGFSGSVGDPSFNQIISMGTQTVPRNWPVPSVMPSLTFAQTSDRTVVYTLTLTVPNISNATGGNMNSALQTTGSSRTSGGNNSMLFKAVMLYQ